MAVTAASLAANGTAPMLAVVAAPHKFSTLAACSSSSPSATRPKSEASIAAHTASNGATRTYTLPHRHIQSHHTHQHAKPIQGTAQTYIPPKRHLRNTIVTHPQTHEAHTRCHNTVISLLPCGRRTLVRAWNRRQHGGASRSAIGGRWGRNSHPPPLPHWRRVHIPQRPVRNQRCLEWRHTQKLCIPLPRHKHIYAHIHKYREHMHAATRPITPTPSSTLTRPYFSSVLLIVLLSIAHLLPTQRLARHPACG